MSLSVSIDIHLKQSESISALKILDVLIKFGWTLIQNGEASYLALGDKDDFNWQLGMSTTLKELNNIFRKKEVEKEIVGVIMNWQNTTIGGSFLFWPQDNYEKFSINLDAYRQTVIWPPDYEVTDFQWYLKKLLPPLNAVWPIEYFSFDQQL